MSNPICSYDFTLKAADVERDKLEEMLNELCKMWVYQLEIGESGYEHFQGRISLKTKTRKTTLVNQLNKRGFEEMHVSPTSSQNMGNDFYVTKEETRKDGPWKSTDKKNYIPRQVREMKELYPWQLKVKELSSIWDKRSINMLLDPAGNTGKSSFTMYMMAHGLGMILPFCNDYKDIMEMAFSLDESKCYFIDMPRAINKEKLNAFFSGLESLKSGFMFDRRYEGRIKLIDCPNIWVFSNKIPDKGLLSADRWKFWTIDTNLYLRDIYPYGEIKTEFTLEFVN